MAETSKAKRKPHGKRAVARLAAARKSGGRELDRCPTHVSLPYRAERGLITALPVATTTVRSTPARDGSYATLTLVSEDTLTPKLSTTMLLSLASLFFFFALVESALASLKRLDSVTNPCQITLDNYDFDLCPLLNEQRNPGQVDLVLRHETPPTITTIVYNISLNGPLPHSDGIPEDEQVSPASANWGI